MLILSISVDKDAKFAIRISQPQQKNSLIVKKLTNAPNYLPGPNYSIIIGHKTVFNSMIA